MSDHLPVFVKVTTHARMDLIAFAVCMLLAVHRCEWGATLTAGFAFCI